MRVVLARSVEFCSWMVLVALALPIGFVLWLVRGVLDQQETDDQADLYDREISGFPFATAGDGATDSATAVPLR